MALVSRVTRIRMMASTSSLLGCSPSSFTAVSAIRAPAPLQLIPADTALMPATVMGMPTLPSSKKDMVSTPRSSRAPLTTTLLAAPIRVRLQPKLAAKDKFRYMQDSNEGLINVVHIENKDAAAHTEELCRREDIDVLFIGPMDISQSLGHPGDPAHPEVQQVVRQVIDTCNANEKPFGIFVGTTEAARKYRDLGASYIAIASDLAFMAKGYHQMVDELKK